MSKFTYHFLLPLFLAFHLGWSQTDIDVIKGVLIDDETKEPVVFATVRLKNMALGVISNYDGSFQIPDAFRLKDDTLVISSMGFETKEIDFSNLRTNSINTITLRPSIFELSETTVTAQKRRRVQKVRSGPSAEQIIARAIERIPENYDENSFDLVGYYRDYQLRQQQYTNLNEGLIRVFDQGFKVKDHTSLKFGLYDYQANFDFEIDSFAAKPYDYKTNDKYIPDAVFRQYKIPNELALLLNHDAIRNNKERTFSYVNTFVVDFIKEHDFTTYFLTNYGDRKVYKIKFKKDYTPFQVKGDIYIDTDTYAIRKIDYAVYRQEPDGAFAEKYSTSDMDLLYEILVEYQKHRNHMYLNYISFHNQFKLTRPPAFFVKDVFIDKITKQMTLVLNKPAANWLQLSTKDFRIYYKKMRLRVKEVVRVGDIGDTYALSFSKKSKAQRSRIKQLISEEKDRQKASLEIIINTIADAQGNLLAQRKSEYIDQFREFFVQQVIPGGIVLDDAQYVDKTISLSDGQQPRLSLEIIEDMWMNTPLQNKQ